MNRLPYDLFIPRDEESRIRINLDIFSVFSQSDSAMRAAASLAAASGEVPRYTYDVARHAHVKRVINAIYVSKHQNDENVHRDVYNALLRAEEAGAHVNAEAVKKAEEELQIGEDCILYVNGLQRIDSDEKSKHVERCTLVPMGLCMVMQEFDAEAEASKSKY